MTLYYMAKVIGERRSTSVLHKKNEKNGDLALTGKGMTGKRGIS